jgi:hypothetical protein
MNDERPYYGLADAAERLGDARPERGSAGDLERINAASERARSRPLGSVDLMITDQAEALERHGAALDRVDLLLTELESRLSAVLTETATDRDGPGRAEPCDPRPGPASKLAGLVQHHTEVLESATRNAYRLCERIGELTQRVDV